MKKVKISVIIPIYNVEEYLDECLMSVKNQTLKDIEVLMIDDGSLDHSVDIAKKYEKENVNFHYFYKKNGGLGNARNYAIPFVNGDYLIFLDSDDIIPKNAYEKMYNLAVETGNDMIIGNVMRFNSLKSFDSPLHKKVFNDDYKHTHILDNPNLVYDTTSWNKLFKTSFYKNNQFQFPEKILYEDIPVTIPAHFKANSVGIISDICYLWRTRDGVSKSITQNRTEIKNFTDRIKIMDMVNKFYEENITDETALFMKDYKWLDVDLKLYVNQFLNADSEYRDIAVREIRRYLDGINPKSLDMLRTIDKMKYYYIKNNNVESLLSLLEYQKTTFKSLSIKKIATDYIGDYPMKDIPQSYKIMTKELEFYPLNQSVNKVEFKKASILIDCKFYIPKLKKQNEFVTKFFLYNRDSNEKYPLDFQRKESKYLTSKAGYRFSRKPLKFVKYNYSQCAYTISIDLSNSEIYKFLEKSTLILVEYSNDLIHKTFFLGKSDNYSLNLIQSYHFNNSIIQTHLINDGNLQIFCKKDIIIAPYKIENNLIFIQTKQQCLLMYNDKKIFFEKNDEYNFLSLDKLEGDGKVHNVFAFEDDKYYELSSEQIPQFIQKENEIIFVENDKKGCLIMTVFSNSVFIEKVIINDKKVNFQISISNGLFDGNAKLVLQNLQYNYRINVDAKSVVEKNGFLKICYEVDFDDEKSIVNISNGNYKFFLQKNAILIEELHIMNNVFKSKIKISKREVSFEVVDNELIMNIKHFWNKYENSQRKRRIARKYLYKLFQKLPIEKKCIVFEDWWGEKYHCNPRYLYEYINQYHPEFKCVWFLNDNYIPIKGNAMRVRRKSLKYFYYLAVAKYFVNNVNFHDEYDKRHGQIEIQTMHGTPLKTLGLDVPGELDNPEVREKFIQRCERWDYLVVQSDKASEITSSCYAFKKEFLRTGYPRNDILFEKNNPKDIVQLKNKLGIPGDKKVIMYAPTWRKRNVFDMRIDIEDMKASLSKDYVLILRVHPFAYSGFNQQIINDFVFDFSSYESMEELYLISDIVITDYSSVMFDYTILNRPILFYTYDLMEYRDFLRGFNFNFENEAPGPLLESYADLKKAIIQIEDVSEAYNDKLQSFRNKFNEYEKGNASQQIFDKVFSK